MAPFYARCGPGEVLPRYSFIEPLLAGRRVLEIGAAGATEGASALFLAERGAAAVLSIEADAEAIERAASAARHPFVQFRRAEVADLPEAAFDLVLVADGGPLATDPGRVEQLRRLVSADGHLVTAIPASGAAGMLALAGERPPHDVPSYESFVGALAAGFEVVEMATQSAMVGYVLAAAEQPTEGEPDIIVDGALAGPAEAAYYLAICGRRPARLSGLTLVALPPRSLAESAVANAEVVAAQAGRPDGAVFEARVVELEERAAGLAARAAELERQANERESALVAKDIEIAEALGRVAQREVQLAEKESRIQQLEIEIEAAQSRAVGLATELERERQALNRTQGVEAQRAAEERTKLLAQLEEARAARLEAEASVHAGRAEGQAARAGLQAALTRAETAEARAIELEDSLEAAQAAGEEARATDRSRLEALEARESERTEALAQCQSLGERARELEARCERAEVRLAELQVLAEAAQCRAEDTQAERDVARARVQELESRLAAEAERIQAAGTEREQAEELAGALLAAEEQARERQAQAEAARSAETEARQRAEAAEALVAQLEERARDAESRASQSVVQVEAAEERVEEAAASAARREEELAEGAQRLAAAMARAQELEDRLAAAESRAAETESRAQGALAQAVEKERQMEGQRADLEAGQAEIRQEAEQLRAQLAERSQELARAVELAREVRASAESAQAQAAGLEAELQAVRWEKDEIEQRLHTATQAGAVASAGEVGRLREELAARISELAELRGRAEKAEAELVRVVDLEIATPPSAPLPSPAPVPDLAGSTAAEAKVQNLERRLAETLAKLAKSEGLAEALEGGAGTEKTSPTLVAIQRLTQERDTFVGQVAERDARIARLQREVADKTERLGRLAKEMGEIKSKGLGKLFSR